jgi:hypothetical protein
MMKYDEAKGIVTSYQMQSVLTCSQVSQNILITASAAIGCTWRRSLVDIVILPSAIVP